MKVRGYYDTDLMKNNGTQFTTSNYMIKKILYVLPVPSTQFFTEAFYYENCILFDYERENTGAVRAGIHFYLPAAIRKTSERCSTMWHLSQDYDTLVEVENSSWIDSIGKDISHHKEHGWKTNHYMIYLDSVGCFEIIAASWGLLPEQKGTWRSVFPSVNDLFPDFYSNENINRWMREARSPD